MHIELNSWPGASWVLPVEDSFLDTSACRVSLYCTGERGNSKERRCPVFGFCVRCLDRLGL